MKIMSRGVARSAAIVAFVAVVACSGVGTCWRLFVAAASHDCCEGSRESAAARPCAGAAAVAKPTAVPGPALAAALHAPLAFTPPGSLQPAALMVAVAPVRARAIPLVLRI